MEKREIWGLVESWLDGRLLTSDPDLEAALALAEANGLPAINVAPNQGKFIHLLAKIHGADRVLEIGTLAGYSTIWLARALPLDGRLVSIEINPDYAEVARANVERAGFAQQVDIRVGRAADVLLQLENEVGVAFDFVFIDADKPSNPIYLEQSLRLTRPGSVIVIDNVVRGGKVATPSEDASIIGVQQVVDLIAQNDRLTATHLQTVGSKGYDGILLIRVNDSRSFRNRCGGSCG